jgi:hypothetical protein
VSFAVRERLEREAAGDFIGVRIVGQDADAHRDLFLGVKRQMSRPRSGSPASLSVEAVRRPFIHDDSLPSATQVSAATVGRQNTVRWVGYADWDMYRPHELQDRAGSDGAERHTGAGESTDHLGRARDMYVKRASKAISGDAHEETTDLADSRSPREPARAPLIVYRDRPPGPDPQE